MQRISLPGLEAFLATATMRNMAEAGRSLGVSRAAVSIAIHRLEGELGLKLFEHKRRKLVLTEAGERCLSRLSPVIRDLHKAVEDLSSKAAAPPH